MLHFIDLEKENLIAAKISGKIEKSDVEKIHPLIHQIVDKGYKVDFYFELEDFHGYELGGLWADLKVDVAHLSDYGKMAMVGNKKWQEWATNATDFFTSSDVRFFDQERKEEAKNWIRQ